MARPKLDEQTWDEAEAIDAEDAGAGPHEVGRGQPNAAWGGEDDLDDRDEQFDENERDLERYDAEMARIDKLGIDWDAPVSHRIGSDLSVLFVDEEPEEDVAA